MWLNFFPTHSEFQGLCIGKNISSASEVDDGLYYFENGLAVWGCLSETTHVSTFLSHENEIEL